MTRNAAAATGSVDPRALQAAVANADWCAAVCRAHGLLTRRDEQRWWSEDRTPLYYPDAVTLSTDVTSTAAVDGVDVSAGCSVKDSFRTLDLTAAGFRVLFDATWIHAPAAAIGEPPPGLRGVVVREQGQLRRWQRAWGEHAEEIFVPALLEDPEVALVSVLVGDTAVGVAALNRSSEVVGVSNVVCAGTSAMSVWQAVAATAADEFPGAALVGYEQGQDLEIATAVGFQQIGPLRVWVR